MHTHQTSSRPCLSHDRAYPAPDPYPSTSPQIPENRTPSALARPIALNQQQSRAGTRPGQPHDPGQPFSLHHMQIRMSAPPHMGIPLRQPTALTAQHFAGTEKHGTPVKSHSFLKTHTIAPCPNHPFCHHHPPPMYPPFYPLRFHFFMREPRIHSICHVYTAYTQQLLSDATNM